MMMSRLGSSYDLLYSRRPDKAEVQQICRFSLIFVMHHPSASMFIIKLLINLPGTPELKKVTNRGLTYDFYMFWSFCTVKGVLTCYKIDLRFVMFCFQFTMD